MNEFDLLFALFVKLVHVWLPVVLFGIGLAVLEVNKRQW
jgi:hypothetical protein